MAEPIADLLGPMPYHVIQTLIDPLWGKGIHAYFKATNLARLDDELIDRLCELHLAAPGPQCEIHVHQMGGAVGARPEDATAFAERSMPFVLNAVTGWHDADGGRGAHGVGTRRDRGGGGRLDRPRLRQLPRRRGRARTSYGAETYDRLVALKNEYDPTNVFRLNQNIEPTGRAPDQSATDATRSASTRGAAAFV